MYFYPTRVSKKIALKIHDVRYSSFTLQPDDRFEITRPAAFFKYDVLLILSGGYIDTSGRIAAGPHRGRIEQLQLGVRGAFSFHQTKAVYGDNFRSVSETSRRRELERFIQSPGVLMIQTGFSILPLWIFNLSDDPTMAKLRRDIPGWARGPILRGVQG